MHPGRGSEHDQPSGMSNLHYVRARICQMTSAGVKQKRWPADFRTMPDPPQPRKAYVVTSANSGALMTIAAACRYEREARNGVLHFGIPARRTSRNAARRPLTSRGRTDDGRNERRDREQALLQYRPN